MAASTPRSSSSSGCAGVAGAGAPRGGAEAEAGCAAVIYVHSHKPHQETNSGVLYFNPGSSGPRRFALPISLGRLIVHAGRVTAELIEL